MFITPRLVALAASSLFMIAGLPALAQNSTQSPPPSATKEGGSEGDPNGAIRSLGGTSTSDFEPGHQQVTIPQFDTRTGGPSRTGGVPEGTTGAGRR